MSQPGEVQRTRFWELKPVWGFGRLPAVKEQCRVRVHLPHPDQRHSHTQRQLKKEAAPCKMAYGKLGCCNKDLHLDTDVSSEILAKQQSEWGDVWT